MASSDSHETRTIFYGAVINPVSLTSYSILPQCMLSIDPSGKIEWMIDCVEKHSLQGTLASKGHIDVDIVFLNEGEFLMPGFIDTHTVLLIARDLLYLTLSCGHSTRLNFRSWERQSLYFSCHYLKESFMHSEVTSISYLTGWRNSFFLRRLSSRTSILHERRASRSLDVS